MTSNTVLITGGSSGIGLELARQLIQLGNTVIVTGRDSAKLAAAKQSLPQLHTYQSDVNDAAAIAKLHEEIVRFFPGLNVLINNAGIMLKINLHSPDVGADTVTREIETNLNAPIRLAQLFLPYLKRQHEAAIVNVTSGLAFVPLPISPVYCAAKAGLHSFTMSLRAQLKHTSVRVFELAPPLTQTTLLDSFDPDDMKGSVAMDVTKLAKAALDGMAKDRFEIRPGQSNLLKTMSRFAPQFIFNQLSKSVDKMLAAEKR
jgi:uncharacterized oxidoreductase